MNFSKLIKCHYAGHTCLFFSIFLWLGFLIHRERRLWLNNFFFLFAFELIEKIEIIILGFGRGTRNFFDMNVPKLGKRYRLRFSSLIFATFWRFLIILCFSFDPFPLLWQHIYLQLLLDWRRLFITVGSNLIKLTKQR